MVLMTDYVQHERTEDRANFERSAIVLQSKSRYKPRATSINKAQRIPLGVRTYLAPESKCLQLMYPFSQMTACCCFSDLRFWLITRLLNILRWIIHGQESKDHLHR